MAEIIKRIGPASYWCKRCAHCDTVELGCMGDVPIYTCSDPYDGVEKKIPGNENITCTMFELANEVPVYELKKKESCDKISLLSHELEMDKLRRKIHELEKEKSDHLKGIERLKKSQEKLQNQVKNLQTTNEESYKREEKLEDKVHKLERRLLEENKRFARLDSEFLIPLLCPIYDILYPDNPNLDINVTDLLNDVKNLKVYADENGQMYKELQEWREKCISLKEMNDNQFNTIKAKNNDIDHLLSANKELEARMKYWSNKAVSRCEELTETKKDRDKWRELYNSLSETCVDYDKRCKEECEKKYRDEIKGLKREIIKLTFDRATVKDIMKKNIKFKETISDQEITIKALLITIKEMCKEENENA